MADVAHLMMALDTFISKTTRLYQDPHTAQASAPQSNMDKLNTDLQDVTRIMTKNMEDLLWRGDSLDRKSCDSPAMAILVHLFTPLVLPACI